MEARNFVPASTGLGLGASAAAAAARRPLFPKKKLARSPAPFAFAFICSALDFLSIASHRIHPGEITGVTEQTGRNSPYRSASL